MGNTPAFRRSDSARSQVNAAIRLFSRALGDRHRSREASEPAGRKGLEGTSESTSGRAGSRLPWSHRRCSPSIHVETIASGAGDHVEVSTTRTKGIPESIAPLPEH